MYSVGIPTASTEVPPRQVRSTSHDPSQHAMLVGTEPEPQPDAACTCRLWPGRRKGRFRARRGARRIKVLSILLGKGSSPEL